MTDLGTGRPADIALGQEGAWVHVGEDAARRHRLYGRGGWMVLLLLGLGLGPVRIIVDLSAAWSELNGAVGSLAVWPPQLQSFRTVLVVYTIATGCVALLMWVFLANLGRQWFADAVRALMLATLAIEWLAVLAMSWALGMPVGELLSDGLLELIAGSAGAVVWAWYLTVSRRVNVTYRHRVRPDDPLVLDLARQFD